MRGLVGGDVGDRQRDERLAVGAAVLATNLGTFLFLVMVARTTDAAIFGALAALTSLSLVFEVPAASLQALVERRSARLGRSGHLLGPVDAGRLLGDTVLWGALGAVVLIAVSPAIERLLRLPSLVPALLLAGYLVPVAVGVVPRGLLLARGRAVWLVVGVGAGVAFRLIVGIVLVHRGDGLTGALAAIVGGEVVAAALCLCGARADLRSAVSDGAAETAVGRSGNGRPASSAGGVPAARGEDDQVWWRAGTGLGVAFTGYWLLGAVGMVLARFWLGADASGWYAAALTAAQLGQLVPGAVAALVFPRVLGAISNATRRLTLVAASAVALVVGLTAALGLSIWAAPAVAHLFDPLYRPSASVVGLLAFSSAMLGLVGVLLHYDLARGWQGLANLAWSGVVALVVGIAIWHSGIVEVAWVTLGATSLACAAMLVAALVHPERARQGGRGPGLEKGDADLDLSVVVPYYNPGELLVPTVRRVLTALESSGATFEVIAVSDGSTDGSDLLLERELGHRPELTSVVYASNQGKGLALRLGLAQGRGRYLGFIDADGDLDPLLLCSFQEIVRRDDPDMVVGSKRHPQSQVQYPRLRRVYSWGYQQLIRLGFRLVVRDTQTGVKLVRRDVLAAALPRMVEKRFAFDLELFVVAQRLGYGRFVEAPIRLDFQFKSTVSWRSVRGMLLDTMAIWYRLRVLHHYDTDLAPATPLTERLRIAPLVVRGSVRAAPGVAMQGEPDRRTSV
jgi:hypothetical protein